MVLTSTTMQQVRANVLDSVTARSLAVGRQGDRKNLRKTYLMQQGEGEGCSTYVQFQGNNGKNCQIPRMSYEEIRKHMSQKLANGKILTKTKVKAVVYFVQAPGSIPGGEARQFFAV